MQTSTTLRRLQKPEGLDRFPARISDCQYLAVSRAGRWLILGNLELLLCCTRIINLVEGCRIDTLCRKSVEGRSALQSSYQDSFRSVAILLTSSINALDLALSLSKGRLKLIRASLMILMHSSKQSLEVSLVCRQSLRVLQ